MQLTLLLIMWDGYACPLLLTLIFLCARTDHCTTGEERRFSAA